MCLGQRALEDLPGTPRGSGTERVRGMDYQSIAARLDIPLGTVRSRLNRSRKALRDALIQVLPDHDHFQAPCRIGRF